MDNRYIEVLKTPIRWGGDGRDRYVAVQNEVEISRINGTYNSLFDEIVHIWMELHNLEYEERQLILQASRLTSYDSLMNQPEVQKRISDLDNREKTWLSHIKHLRESTFTEDQRYQVYNVPWDPNMGWDSYKATQYKATQSSPDKVIAPIVPPEGRTQLELLSLKRSLIPGLQTELNVIKQETRRLKNEKIGISGERVHLTNDCSRIVAEHKNRSKQHALDDFINHIDLGDTFLNKYGRQCTVTGKSATYIDYRLSGPHGIEHRSIPVELALDMWRDRLDKPKSTGRPTVGRHLGGKNKRSDQTDVELLEWEVLPQGWWDNPGYLRTSAKTKNERLLGIIDRDRLRFVASLGESKAYAGSPKFGPVRYYVFVFESWVIAECPNEGNAIYVIKGQEDWQNLLGRSKGELRSDFRFRVNRVIHRGDWKSRLKNAMQ